MNILKRIAEVDRSTLWRVFAIATGLLAAVFLLYDHFRDSSPRVVFEVIANAAVVDIKEEVPKLGVLYDGTNIRQQGQSLQIVTVKVLNASTVDILKDRYDPKDPFGITVSQGRIVQCDPLATSNDYLRRNLTLRHDSQRVFFPDIIIEGGQYFVVKLLLLVPAGSSAEIAPAGHIGGIQTVPVVESYRDIGQPGIVARIFAGSIWIQIVRLISYAILFVLIVISLAIPTAWIKHGSVPMLRRRHVKLFKMATMVPLDGSEEWIFDLYRKGDAQQILALRNIVCDDAVVEGTYKILKADAMMRYDVPTSLGWFLTAERAKMVFENRLITVENGMPKANEHHREVLTAFVAFLLKNQVLAPHDLPVPESKVYLYGNGTDMFIQVTQGDRVYGMRIPNGQVPTNDPRFKSYLGVDGARGIKLSGKDGGPGQIPLPRNVPVGEGVPGEPEAGTSDKAGGPEQQSRNATEGPSDASAKPAGDNTQANA